MKRTQRFKAILASLLVTVALAAPAAVLSSDEPAVEAELCFTSEKLEMLSDGTVQAIFTVSVDKALNCNGASFVLDYNPDYFTPSYMTDKRIGDTDHKQNEAFTSTTDAEDDGFFAYDPYLYRPDQTPFQVTVRHPARFDPVSQTMVEAKESNYSTVGWGDHVIAMHLWFDREKIIKNQPTTGSGWDEQPVEEPVGKLAPLHGASLGGTTGNEESTVYVINKYDTEINDKYNVDPDNLEPVILGRLSFQVDPDRLDEIARYFPLSEREKTPIAERELDGVGRSYMIRTTKVEKVSDVDNWQIPVYWRDPGTTDSRSIHYYRYKAAYDTQDMPGRGERYYDLWVDPKQIMKVRPAEESVTINAYQAYTDGGWGDVAQALRRYSPMANVTYVDGTQESWVIPWGQEGENAGYTIEVRQADGTFKEVKRTDFPPDPVYDPLEGVYRVTQYVPGRDKHPLPITVTLTVTPIKLIDVQVENEILTYNLSTVVSDVKSPSDLKLPEKARLITDIVPSGVSMVMNIPGWAPKKGSWPNSADLNSITLMNSLLEDDFGTSAVIPEGDTQFDPNTMPYWPDDNDNGPIASNQYWRFLKKKNGHWIGEYTFHMAETFGGKAKPGFTKEEIQAVYPWLTMDEEKDIYPVPEPLRQIVTGETYTNALQYTASYVSTTLAQNGQPELTLSVKRGDGTSPMAEGSIFRVWLPNGQELGNGVVINNVWPNYPLGNGEDEVTPGDWFPNKGTSLENGFYDKEAQGGSSNRFFHLITNPGDPSTGHSMEEREVLRRYINLGGWYYVAVCEDPATKTWSDPMPVFVPARPNEYQEDKVYNFIGENTELFNWPGDLTHYVTMPRGTYTTVNDKGERYYNVKDNAVTLAEMQASDDYKDYLDKNGRPLPTVARYEESYGYHTTYDGATGAQPGTLYTFRVGPTTMASGAKWEPVKDGVTSALANPGNQVIWRYGPSPFYDGAVYPAYVANFYDNTDPRRTTTGIVTQPVAAQPYHVTIRRNDDDKQEKPKRSHITLTSAEPAGISRRDTDNQVTLADYDTRTVGYTDRQAYTFTITNDGDVPIYGLAIDGLTDGTLQEETGGRFVLLQAPAEFLAPGQSTDFVMTYVYNLPESGATQLGTYRDKLYIISSDHPNGKYGGTNQDNPAPDESKNDYLLDFDAQFKVSDFEIHTVTVIVNPEAPLMGDAGLIVGQATETSPMNYTPTARAYAAGTKVYVAVYKKDEYELVTEDKENPYLPCRDAAGNTFRAERLRTAGNGDDILPGIEVYWFDMPAYNTIVTVNFYEPILSKLRITDLVDFSAGKKADLKRDYEDGSKKAHYEDVVDEENTYHVWRKSFTDKELKEEAPQWVTDTTQNPDKGFYLATVGTAVPEAQDGNKFLNTHDQYIVVIPHDAAYSQVQVTLRKLETHSDYAGPDTNEDIQPEVTMDLYKWGFAEKWRTEHDMHDDVRVHSDTAGFTGKSPNYDPSIHTSIVFDSPAVNTSDYVRITVSAGNESRYYYLEIHRAPEEPIATLNYGNSPYGMIMNDVLFRRGTQDATKAAQDAVKESFRNNGYTFNGLDSLNVPYLVRMGKDGGEPAVSQRAVYWREAWVHNTQLFEPESLTGFDVTYPTPTPTPTPTSTPTPGPDATPSPSPSDDPDTNRREPVIKYDSKVYVEEENLDLNDHAFFAILGEGMKEPGIAEALDSTGRPVDLESIRAQVKVTLLDTDATTQISRFSGTKEILLDLGTAGGSLDGLSGTDVGAEGTWPVHSETGDDPITGERIKTYTRVENIRPGQYTLEYVYGDYNGKLLTVRRPLVILPAIGDVNADGQRDYTDETVLKNRVADPLGYVAGRWELVETSAGKWEWKETVYERSNIFKYRVVDVNNDRNVNNIDGNLIRKIVGNKAKPIRFYNPVEYINK